MPCGRIPCDSDDDNYIPNSNDTENYLRKFYEDKYSKELNFLTYIACEYFTKLEAQGIKIPEYAIAWWENHKEEDRIRIENELRREKEEKRRQLEEAIKKKEEAEKIIKKLTS